MKKNKLKKKKMKLVGIKNLLIGEEQAKGGGMRLSISRGERKQRRSKKYVLGQG